MGISQISQTFLLCLKFEKFIWNGKKIGKKEFSKKVPVSRFVAINWQHLATWWRNSQTTFYSQNHFYRSNFRFVLPGATHFIDHFYQISDSTLKSRALGFVTISKSSKNATRCFTFQHFQQHEKHSNGFLSYWDVQARPYGATSHQGMLIARVPPSN